MRKIVINPYQYNIIKEGLEEEITFYEFAQSVKKFIHELLKKPASADIDGLLKSKTDKKHLIEDLKKLGILSFSEKIDEIEDETLGKKVAKRFVQYGLSKDNFSSKLHKLYDSIIMKNESVFANEKEMIEDIKSMDTDNAYKNRGGYKNENHSYWGRKKENLDETDCAGVGGGTGASPFAGATNSNISANATYDVSMGGVQGKKTYNSFWSDSKKRNKDEKNGSISMNRQS